MEYAAGGELFERICNAGRFSEDEVCMLRILNLEGNLKVVNFYEFPPLLASQYSRSYSVEENTDVLLTIRLVEVKHL